MPETENIVFISDLHISKFEPLIEQRFLKLLAKLPAKARGLYILGDWFDLWLRDEINIAEYPKLVKALKTTVDNGLEIYFMPGNRDFLLGKKFSRETRVNLIADPHKIKLNGKAVVLTHGDRLCTDDRSYQRYMKVIQHPVSKFVLKTMPRFLLKAIANKIKSAANTSKNKKQAFIMDVNIKAVEHALSTADVLIHGHTHRPAIHRHGEKLRLVMSDWSQEAKIVVFDGKEFSLISEALI